MASSLTAAGEMCRSIAPEIAVLVGYGLLAICVLGIASGRSVSIRVGALALSVA